MAVNKVVLGEDTLIDLTADTVSADKLSKGVTAHDMAGEPIVGTMEATGGKEYTFTNGLTETNGTVSWDLNDRIKAGEGEGTICIGTPKNTVSTYSVVGNTCYGNTGKSNIIFGNNCVSQYGNAAPNYCIVVGSSCYVEDSNSQAFGNSIRSSSKNQMCIGKYNVSDANNTYVFIIGNGNASSNRSNAYTLDWQGNQYLSGDIYTNCTDYTTTSTGLNTPRCGGNKVLTNAIFSLDGTELTITTE